MQWKENLFEETINDANSTFDDAFLGTPPTKRAHRSYEPFFKIKVIIKSRKSSVAYALKMYSFKENALEKSAQSPKPLKSLGSGRKPLNLELEDEMFCYFVSRIF